MSMGYITYLVGQGESIESIANSQLGHWSRWREIAGLNNLRYPYISDRPDQWFGPHLTTGILEYSLPKGSAAIRLLGERKEVVPPRSILFLDGYDQNNVGNYAYSYDILPVLSFDGTNGTVTLDKAVTQHRWPEGTRYRVFSPLEDSSAKVARPGQRIFLPIVVGDSGVVLSPHFGEDEARTLYGTDIELSRDGKLTLVNGDLSTVEGFDNIYQALRFRAELPYGSYIVHTDEGNRCFYLIGEPVRPETPLRASAYIRDALETDPRVSGVTQVSANVDKPDQIGIAATVQLSRTQEAVSVNTVLRNRS